VKNGSKARWIASSVMPASVSPPALRNVRLRVAARQFTGSSSRRLLILYPVCHTISALGERTICELCPGLDAGISANPIHRCTLPPSGHPRALLQFVDRGNDADTEHPRLGVALHEEPVDATACILSGLLAVALDEQRGRRVHVAIQHGH